MKVYVIAKIRREGSPALFLTEEGTYTNAIDYADQYLTPTSAISSARLNKVKGYRIISWDGKELRQI